MPAARIGKWAARRLTIRFRGISVNLPAKAVRIIIGFRGPNRIAKYVADVTPALRIASMAVRFRDEFLLLLARGDVSGGAMLDAKKIVFGLSFLLIAVGLGYVVLH